MAALGLTFRTLWTIALQATPLYTKLSSAIFLRFASFISGTGEVTLAEVGLQLTELPLWTAPFVATLQTLTEEALHLAEMPLWAIRMFSARAVFTLIDFWRGSIYREVLLSKITALRLFTALSTVTSPESKTQEKQQQGQRATPRAPKVQLLLFGLHPQAPFH